MPISRKILVVEDDLTFANLTRGLLTSEKVKAAHEVSFEIDHAGDLASALKKLRSTEYDGIILDLSLPDCEGMQGLANITDLRNDIPVIVLTGDDDPETYRRAIAHGAQKYLLKKYLTGSTGGAELFVLCILHAIDQMEISRLERHWLSTKVIQRRLEPAPLDEPGLELGAICQPFDTFGGDFYHWAKLPDGRIMLLVADAIGHDLAAAIAMVGLAKFVRSQARHTGDLRAIISAVNADLHFDLKDEKASGVKSEGLEINKFVCLFIAAIDLATGELEYYGAGQNAYLATIAGEITELEAKAPPLGIFAEGCEFPHCEMKQLRQGDVVVIATDGIHESRDIDQQQWGYDAMFDQIRNTLGESADRIAKSLCGAARDHCRPSPANDDCTVLTAKYQKQSLV